MKSDVISVRGCRVHNLQNINVDIPRGKLIAICGLSGSGKTSLALDTLYAEGQRCYIESFSAYTRQFLQRLDKPDCDQILGIPPAIAVTRAGGSKTNRSTVGTTTEIADHLRLLFSKASKLICNGCGEPVQSDDPSTVAEKMQGLKTRSMICFSLWLPSRKAASEILLGLQQEGYVRLIVGGETFHLSDSDRTALAKKVGRKATQCIVVVDRLSGDAELGRLTESLETAMYEGNGRAIVLSEPNADSDSASSKTMAVDGRDWDVWQISRDRRCDDCDLDFPDPVPRLFNFNNPLGACPKCEGFGELVDVDMDLVVPDKSLSLAEGAIACWNTPAYSHELDELLELADDYDLPVDVPYKKLKKKHLKLIQRGVPEREFGGLDGFFAWLDRKKYKMHVRVFASRFRSYRLCDECDGKRFKPETLAYKIGESSIADVLTMQADEAEAFFKKLKLPAREKKIAAEPLTQIRDRIGYLQQVGLGYLQFDRTLRTLSGGETQRVALTSALGSSLLNMLYVLDEPTAGLHPTDVQQLSAAIIGLRDRGNTVIVVEHDETLIKMADRVIEIGPAAGVSGGNVTFEGTPKAMLKDKDSITGQFLSGKRGWSLRGHEPRSNARGTLKLTGASGHNLKNIDVEFPLGVLCLVTGVSGSGKSSLVQDTLYAAIRQRKNGDATKPLPYDSISGLSQFEDCMLIDQSPISRSARSCPVTYVKAFDPIRKVFAATIDAKTRNFTPTHFTFNSEVGRCPNCEGAGVLEIDMQFLANVSMTCPTCRGTRYRDEILDVKFRDRNIAEVLGMTTRQAFGFFRGQTKVQARLKRLIDVGLEYIALGQAATTLSSGEGQRLKLAAFLASAKRKRTLFILDEPTTGLHFADIVRLVDCFDALLVDGHTLIVVEHNSLLMQASDYLIDLGPGAAAEGGNVVACGTPAEVSRVKKSRTGQILKAEMARK